MNATNNGGNGGGVGPCGACKFLRRKCVQGCIFAPYFDPDQGTTHFAAVHKVFGASNASKLLLRIPPHKRLDAVLTLCYEALARVKDPVYGCVSHIFTLQQQVVNLQAELAYVQAHLSTMQRFPAQAAANSPSRTTVCSASDMVSSNVSSHFGHQVETNIPNFNMLDQDNIVSEGDFQALAQEFVSQYFPEVKYRPQCPP